jgi:hypothetical protein
MKTPEIEHDTRSVFFRLVWKHEGLDAALGMAIALWDIEFISDERAEDYKGALKYFESLEVRK